MRLGLNLGYWGAGNDAENLALAQEADQLGYAVCWAAEAYGSDAATVLAYVAAQTRQIDIGSAVFQIPARTPAMTAATWDSLSGGRFRLGLGVSGPQVSEGWHGVRFDRPLARTREYIDIVSMALRRDRVSYGGEFYTLPLPEGPGKALQLTVRPTRARIPLYLAAVGPKNLELAGEVADGWLGIFFAPEFAEQSLDPIRAGRLAAGHGTPENPLDGFDIVPTVPVSMGTDLEAAADRLRDYTALYVGGMGSRQKNFYNALVRRMGYEDVAQRVQELYLDRKPREAAAELPLELIDRTALLGDSARIGDRMKDYAAVGVSTLTISPALGPIEQRREVLRAVVAAAEAAGVLS